MKIALWSSWRERCGVATYTRDLGGALATRGHTVTVLAPSDRGGLDDGFNTLDSTPCWTRGEPVYDRLKQALHDLAPDVLHVQHEHGLFPSTDALLEALRSIPTPSVLTLHTVSSGTGHGPGLHVDRRIVNAARATVVHSAGAKMTIGEGHGAVVHIPHGTTIRAPMDRAEARLRLGIPQDAFVALTHGYLSADKLIYETGLGVLKAQLRVPNLYWILAGCAASGAERDGRDETVSHLAGVRALEILQSRLLIVPHYVVGTELDAIYGAADVAVLHCAQTPYSISGQSHMAMGYGLPVLASAVPLYDDVRDVGRLFPIGPHGVATVLWETSEDTGLRTAMAERSKAFAAVTAWPVVAERHSELYEKVAAGATIVAPSETPAVPEPLAPPGRAAIALGAPSNLAMTGPRGG